MARRPAKCIAVDEDDDSCSCDHLCLGELQAAIVASTPPCPHIEWFTDHGHPEHPGPEALEQLLARWASAGMGLGMTTPSDQRTYRVMATWPTPTPTVELRSAPGHPDAAIDVYLQLHGRNTAIHGVSPDLAITLGADPDRPILRIAPELVPELAAVLRSVLGALEAL